MNLALLTISTPELKAVRDISEPVNWSYCRWYGYGFIQSARLTDRPPSWDKVALLLRKLSDYDYIWIVDADCVVTNPGITLESIIDLAPGADMLITKDTNGINAGSVIVKNTAASRKFYQSVWDMGPVASLPPTWWKPVVSPPFAQAGTPKLAAAMNTKHPVRSKARIRASISVTRAAPP